MEPWHQHSINHSRRTDLNRTSSRSGTREPLRHSYSEVTLHTPYRQVKIQATPGPTTPYIQYSHAIQAVIPACPMSPYYHHGLHCRLRKWVLLGDFRRPTLLPAVYHADLEGAALAEVDVDDMNASRVTNTQRGGHGGIGAWLSGMPELID